MSIPLPNSRYYVYILKRGNECLYVGMTNDLFKRFKKHKFINPKNIQDKDVIEIRVINNVKEARELEKELQIKLEAKYGLEIAIKARKQKIYNAEHFP